MILSGIFILLLVVQGLALDLGRITNGENATPHKFPYQVSIQWGLPPLLKFRHICGGSILNENWILTAGHCVTEIPKFGKLQINAGKHYIDRVEPGQEVRPVTLKIVHHNYPGGIAQHDIALMRMKIPLTFNRNVQPVNLPKQNVVHTGKVVLTGWGSISTGLFPKLPTELQTAEIPIVDYKSCFKAFVAVSNKFELFDTQVCTGPIGSDISACSGDSGGPLVQFKDGQPEQVGIVSWGNYPCGVAGTPTVYTRVSSYVNWIQSKLNIS